MIFLKTYQKKISRLFILAVIALNFSACAVGLKTKVSGNLKRLSPLQTVAILPFETAETGQTEIANLLRQSLYANLKDSNFKLMERYLIDSILKSKGWNEPKKYKEVNPMEFAEFLGVDAVVLGRVDKIERSYWILHSSIELGVSVQMIDTRSGEVLWEAEQREKDFEGLGKIPTGITAAVFAPIEFVTNKLNLHKLMTGMVSRLTAIVKSPETIKETEVASVPKIVPASSSGLKELKAEQKMQEEWESSAENKERKKDKNVESLKALPLAPEKQAVSGAEAIRKRSPLQSEKQNAIGNARSPMIQGKRETVKTPFGEILSQAKSKQAPSETAMQAKVVSIKKPGKDPVKMYTVQVGAYKTKSFAERLFGTLTRKGYDVFVSLFSRNKKKLYRVQVDKFERKEDAMVLAQKIRKQEKLQSFITTYIKG